MSLCNRVTLPFVLFALAFLAGCGGSNTAVTPPGGGFGNTNLSGTYAFSTVGTDVNGVFIDFAGTFMADGKGDIESGGTLDVNDPELGFFPGLQITGGSYNVGVDGRPTSGSGLLSLQTAQGTFVFDYVLSSSNGGLITYYDTNSTYGGTGSGAFALQTTVSQSSINNQSYAFNFSGVFADLGSEIQNPFAIAGAFALDNNGNATGVEDVNNGGITVCDSATGCSITSGQVSLATVPGTASFTSSAGTFNFDVYPVTPTQLIFIQSNPTASSTPFLTVGNAFTQSSSIPTGNNVFSLAGLDPSAGLPLTAVGLFVTDGNGNIQTSSTEDVNDAGNYIGITNYTGQYTTPSAAGRATITLSGFINEGSLGCSNCEFAAYPSTGGTQLLEIDGFGGITGGTAYLQGSSPTFASSQSYGMDLTGDNISQGTPGVEEDDIAQFTYSSSGSPNLSPGLIDFNDEGSTSFDQTFTSTYAPDTTGIPGRGVVTAGTNAYDLITYVVNPSTSVAIVPDSGMIALGTLNTQSATAASSNAAAQHLASLRAATPRAKALKKKRPVR